MKTGIDIIEIERFKMLDAIKFLDKYFTIDEVNYIASKKNKFQTIAGMYAAKEAVLKAFKIGIGNGISLKDIEIFHENGYPMVKQNKIIKNLLEKQNSKEIDVNISHCENYALAVCIIN